MGFNISEVVNGRETCSPQRFFLYGVQGVGKTLCASTFKNPIVLRTEDGTAAIDVPTFPHVAKRYEDVLEALTSLHGEHNFETLVVDSLDWMEPLVWRHVCETNPDKDGNIPASIESFGFGKGYSMADPYWRHIQSGFDSLRFKKRMQIVLIAHTEIKTFNPPDSDGYDRYQPKLNKRAFAFWQEWADNVFFVNYDRRLVDMNGRRRAEGDGNRIIYTTERPAYLAKNRWGLPDEIYIGQDKTWRPLHDALKKVMGDKYPYPFEK